MKQLGLAKSHRTSELRCPECGQVNDAASAVTELTKHSNPMLEPESGDLSICINCGHFSIFGDDLKLRTMTEEEKVKWAGNPMLIQTSEALAKIKRRN